MLPVEHLCLLIIFHFVGDFLLQSDEMAIKKSSNNKWLLIHGCMYGWLFIYFGILFAVVNTVAHLITDYFSSRATSMLYKAGQRHWFFVVIGLDQMIHLLTLVISYHYIVK